MKNFFRTVHMHVSDSTVPSPISFDFGLFSVCSSMIYHMIGSQAQNHLQLPPPPFGSKPKRYHSEQGSTVCATPTIQEHSPFPSPSSLSFEFHSSKLMLPLSRETNVLAAVDSPRIPRAAVDVPGYSHEVPYAIHAPRISNTVCTRLYDFRRPPVPKQDSIYKRAKETEYHGDYDTAMLLYLKAIELNDRPESAIKDYAGLLHMRGKTEDAISFLETNGENMKDTPGFKNLMSQLRNFLLSTETGRKDLPKTIYLSTDSKEGTEITLDSMPSFFPNHLKITGITFINPVLSEFSTPSTHYALIEFASHSAARKALTISKHSSVDCMWASDSLLEHDHIVVADLESVSLISSGPVVNVRFAAVPIHVIRTEWPSQLSHKTPNSNSQSPGSASTSISEAQSPLRLPLTRRSKSPPKESVRNNNCAVLNMEVIDHSPGFVDNMDWCLNTPSPIRHFASLL